MRWIVDEVFGRHDCSRMCKEKQQKLELRWCRKEVAVRGNKEESRKPVVVKAHTHGVQLIVSPWLLLLLSPLPSSLRSPPSGLYRCLVAGAGHSRGTAGNWVWVRLRPSSNFGGKDRVEQRIEG